MDGMKNASKKDVAVRALGTTPCLVILQSFRNTSSGFLFHFFVSYCRAADKRNRGFHELRTDSRGADAELAVELSSSSAPRFPLWKMFLKRPTDYVWLPIYQYQKTLIIVIHVKRSILTLIEKALILQKNVPSLCLTFKIKEQTCKWAGHWEMRFSCCRGPKKLSLFDSAWKFNRLSDRLNLKRKVFCICLVLSWNRLFRSFS